MTSSRPQIAATMPSTTPPTRTTRMRPGSRSRSSTPVRKTECDNPAHTPCALIETPRTCGLNLVPDRPETKGQSMRIVAGEQRGRRLVAPKGHSTRPTADRTRQALFNVLEHAAWSRPPAGLQALDLFAGSGALGLEAVSRGAAFCLFVDTDPAAREAIAA